MIRILSITITLGLLACGGSRAAIITLYNTGVNGSGTVLADGSFDPHYTIISSPFGGLAPHVTSQSTYPLNAGVWVPDSTTSKWISPFTDVSGSITPGSYIYRTTFTLPSDYNPATASISGFWGSDDGTTAIRLNGTFVTSGGGFSGLTFFSTSSGFVADQNTLDFVVSNAGGPTGLRVQQMSGTAAQANIASTDVTFGAVRVGTSASQNLTVRNTGESGSSLTGTIGASSNNKFTPGSGTQAFSLSAGAFSIRNFTYAPTSRGADSTIVAINNNRSNTTRTLSGTAVGPVFSTSLGLGGTLDFGDVTVGDTGTQALELQNATTDIGYSDALTGLTLLNYAISGADASMFSLTGFTSGIVLSQGELLNLDVLFTPTGAAMSRSAVLTFYTDQGVSFGANGGQSFSFNLQANAYSAAVPEPGMAGLWLVGGVVCWRYGRSAFTQKLQRDATARQGVES